MQSLFLYKSIFAPLILLDVKLTFIVMNTQILFFNKICITTETEHFPGM